MSFPSTSSSSCACPAIVREKIYLRTEGFRVDRIVTRILTNARGVWFAGSRCAVAALRARWPRPDRPFGGRQERTLGQTSPSLLVVSAHAGDFVWRAGGAIAAATMRGERATVVCLSYGERGESASQWLQGKTLDEIKAIRRDEATAAASALGAEIEFLDLGDYPLVESPEAVAKLVDVYRRVQPTVVLTHPLADPYNGDHPAAARMALQARVLAQAIGVANSDGTFPSTDEIIGAPPVFFFEPHQPEQCDFKPNVLLDITAAFPLKQKAHGVPARAEAHVGVLHRPRGAPGRAGQAQRRPEPRACRCDTMGEAYMRYYPQVTDVLA